MTNSKLATDIGTRVTPLIINETWNDGLSSTKRGTKTNQNINVTVGL